LHTLAAGSAPAASKKSSLDVSGIWTAKIESGGPPGTMVFVFKQVKGKLTGTLSTNGGPPVEIRDGKVYRSIIRFSVETAMPERPATPLDRSSPQGPASMLPMKYDATVDGDTMTLVTVAYVPSEMVSKDARALTPGQDILGCDSGRECASIEVKEIIQAKSLRITAMREK
jgi:hypothetical protein